MPTIHVSQDVFEEISKRQKGEEAPTETLRRVMNRDEETIERIVENKIEELHKRGKL